jgi:CRISPR-associated exonuclease Cas4
MQLQRITVPNFRSLRDLDLECQTIVTQLGPNNHAKSNLLSAVEFDLSTSAKPAEEEFLTHRDDDVFWVEVTFGELTEQEANTFKRYVCSDRTVCVPKTCHWRDGGLDAADNRSVEQPDEVWLRGENAADCGSWDKIGLTPLKDLVPPGGRIAKAIVEAPQQQFPERLKHIYLSPFPKGA